MTQGIFTGCDKRHEWMLKWWWTHYSTHNIYPVVFCDFGMSHSARLWCESKGTVLSLNLPDHFITPKEHLDPNLLKKWKLLYKNTSWGTRKACFYKPFVFPHTPFDETIWIDLDAQVKKPLIPFFNALKKSQDGFALCKDTPLNFYLRLYLGCLLPKESAYQARVIVYKKASPIIQQWLEICKKYNHLFFSDQDVLNRIIHEKQYNIYELSNYYNYIPGDSDLSFPDPLIIHYATSVEKEKKILN